MILVAIVALSLVVVAVVIPLVQAIFAIDVTFGTVLSTLLAYITQGASFAMSFFYTDILYSLIAAVIVIEAAELTYNFVMWIITKIPLLAIGR